MVSVQTPQAELAIAFAPAEITAARSALSGSITEGDLEEFLELRPFCSVSTPLNGQG